MNIKIEKFNFSESIQVQALTKWDCDKELFHLATPVPNEKMALEYPSEFEEIKKYQDPNFAQGVYIIWDNDKPIGNLSIQVDPPHLMKKVSGTSWLGLIIGEKEYWGTGAAVIAMKFFEDESLRLGLKRIELGTFEFNIRAQNFYKKLGYTEIGRLKNYRLIKGDTLMRKVLEDATVGLSVLLSVEGVDPNRVGALGHSYGGNTTLFQAALDQRIQFACASGAVCSYKNKMERGTGLEFSLAIPNIFHHFDFTDILSAVGPKPFLVVSANEDKYAQDADVIVEDCKKRFGSMSDTLHHFRYHGGHALTSERFNAIVNWLVERS